MAPERPLRFICDAIATSGNQCDVEAVYVWICDDSHCVYACEMHRDMVMLDVADNEGAFRFERVAS